MTDSANLPWFLHNRRLTEYNRDFGVCKVGNQSQQLQALMESRYQAEHQQLAEIGPPTSLAAKPKGDIKIGESA